MKNNWCGFNKKHKITNQISNEITTKQKVQTLSAQTKNKCNKMNFNDFLNGGMRGMVENI